MFDTPCINFVAYVYMYTQMPLLFWRVVEVSAWYESMTELALVLCFDLMK